MVRATESEQSLKLVKKWFVPCFLTIAFFLYGLYVPVAVMSIQIERIIKIDLKEANLFADREANKLYEIKINIKK